MKKLYLLIAGCTSLDCVHTGGRVRTVSALQVNRSQYTRDMRTLKLSPAILMLQSTQLIKDNYVVFPLPDAITEFNLTTTACQLYSGISTLTWILLPFYYLPLLGLLVVVGVALINYLRSISITCIYYFFVYGELMMIFSIPSTEQGLCGPKNLLT